MSSPKLLPHGSPKPFEVALASGVGSVTGLAEESPQAALKSLVSVLLPAEMLVSSPLEKASFEAKGLLAEVLKAGKAELATSAEMLKIGPDLDCTTAVFAMGVAPLPISNAWLALLGGGEGAV